MNKKNFITLCLISIFAIFIAGFGVLSLPKNLSSDFKEEIVFPELINSLDDISTLILEDKDKKFTLALEEGNWVLKERNNFPVDNKKLGDLLVSLSRIQKVEPKTSLKTRYSRLDLESLTLNKESRIKKVILLDKNDNKIINLSIGKRKFTLGSNEGGTYVLFPDDPQVWLVTGELNPGVRVRDWVDRKLVNIKDEQLERVTLVHPDGEKIVVERISNSDEHLSIKNIPNGKEPIRDSITNEIGRMLSNLMFDDVVEASSIEFLIDKTIKAEFETFSGFKINISLFEDGENNWIKISGIHNKNKILSKDKGDEITNWAGIIDELNNKSKDWVYQFPGYEVAGLKQRMKDLVSDKEE
jgi:hypothetical protein